MRQVSRVTRDGYYVEPAILADGEPCPVDCVTVNPDNTKGLYWPKWSGTLGEDSRGEWFEGGGLYRQEPDGSVDPARRYDAIARPDGSRVQRGVDGVIKELASEILK